ncbi:SART-1 family-domain-containing protein [Melampsora americana]|nr:SART-1 family-domain-containing protein [Melampsora americana]
MSQVKESLSIEETNKIRVSLGLKPLPIPGSTTTEGSKTELTSEEKAELNYTRRRAEEAEAKKSKEIQDRIYKAKNKRELSSKLKGRGLGEISVGEEDTEDLKKWVKRQKKQSKKLAEEAARKEKEIAEQEIASYGENDLQGLKVAHQVDEFEQGDEVVLTLRDNRILDDDDDELENVNMKEASRDKELLSLKRKGKSAGQYTGYDDDEFLNPGQSNDILSKYNEEIDGKKDKSFRLGVGISVDESSVIQSTSTGDSGNRNSKERTAELLKTGLMSLEYTKTIGSDYVQEGEAGFKKAKKSKKKKEKSSRKPTAILEEEEIKPKADQMDIDSNGGQTVVPSLPMVTEDNMIDDEEIQAAMSRMRREAGKIRNKRQKKLEESEPTLMVDAKGETGVELDLSLPRRDDDEDDDDPDALVIDDTSEFIRTISLQQERAAAARKKEEAQVSSSRIKSIDLVIENQSNREESEKAESQIDEEEERRTMERLMAGDEPMQVDSKLERETPTEQQDTSDYGGTGAEKYVRGGMASTLSLLKSQGLIKPLTPEEREKERLYKEKTSWLIEQRRRDTLRELEKERTKRMGDAKDQATREYENRMRESMMAKESMEAYRNYKPDVEIKYNDEFGRELTQKEAWKALSHKFHGKGSGKAKTEKRIKKIEEEKKLAAMASGDTPTGTNEAFRKRQEKLGSATMVLSVGNKGSAPHQEEFLSSLTKTTPGAGGSKKSKSDSKTKSLGYNTHNRNKGQHHTISVAPDLMNGLGSSSNSGISSGLEGFQTPSGLMAPRKAGFKPIANQKSLLNSVLDSNQINSATHQSKSKILIGLNGNGRDGKRKAEDGVEENGRNKRTG